MKEIAKTQLKFFYPPLFMATPFYVSPPLYEKIFIPPFLATEKNGLPLYKGADVPNFSPIYYDHEFFDISFLNF